MIINEDYLIGVDEERERQENSTVKTYRKPKVRLYRLAQDKMKVPIELDIPINDHLTIKERFDWKLQEQEVSPISYIKIFCKRFQIKEKYRDKMIQQLLDQLLEYIDKNTKIHRRGPNQETIEEEVQEENIILFQNPLDEIQIQEEKIKDNQQNQDQNEEDQQQQQLQQQQQAEEPTRKTTRQRRIEEMKKTQSSQIYGQQKSTYYRDKKVCKICENVNVGPNNRCKKCQFPFEVAEEIKLDDPSQKTAALYYNALMQFSPILNIEFDEYEELKAEDFISTFNLMQVIFERMRINQQGLCVEDQSLVVEFAKSVYIHFRDDTWEEEEARLEEQVELERQQQKLLRKEAREQERQMKLLKQEQELKEKQLKQQQNQQLKNKQLQLEKSKLSNKDVTQTQQDSDEEDVSFDEKGKKINRKAIKKRGRPKKEEEDEGTFQGKETASKVQYQTTTRRNRTRRTDI